MLHAVANGVYPVAGQRLPFYRVQAFEAYPNLTHAIFTRQGGFSRSPFETLNLSVSVGDDPVIVRKNFERACAEVAVTPEQTVSCPLVHGAEVLTITATNRQMVMGQADGLITAEPEIYLFMRFGDCTPLILFDPVRGAVGLAHAGWRGAMKNIAGATVKTMVKNLGCKAENIMAVIGPAIGPCCYEVGPEVMQAAEKAFPQPQNLFTYPNGQRHKAHFDLWAANRQQFAAEGVKQMITSGLCTACRTEQFFSNRAENGRTGRFGVVVGLKGAAG
jgi:polyphenol oxidase